MALIQSKKRNSLSYQNQQRVKTKKAQLKILKTCFTLIIHALRPREISRNDFFLIKMRACSTRVFLD